MVSTDQGGTERIVPRDAGIFAGPAGPLIVAIEPRHRVDSALPHEKHLVVVLVCDNTMPTGMARAFEEFGDAGAHPR